MEDRALTGGASGWGRSVHKIQHMPAPALRHTDQTMDAILHQGNGRSVEH